MANAVRYLVFDTESVADPRLVAQVRASGEAIDPNEAVRRFRSERLEETGSDFIPYTYQLPVSVAVAKVTSDFRLLDVVVLDEPRFRPHVITEYFWRGWEKYDRPTLVTFNGRAFDIPLLELAAFRFGISVPGWFAPKSRGYDQPRNRFNAAAHIDLCELLTNFGATRFHGGLNLAAATLGKPGKMEVQGHMVQDLYDEGLLSEINDYCRCDVLDTYFVFLRTRVLLGELSLEAEQARIRETKQWLEARADQRAVAMYLAHWGEWPNPWTERSDEPVELVTDEMAEPLPPSSLP